ncbi:hypothetical protein [Bacillus sp. AFS023182]|uniref:hypothetical protein n=1 Tax=Bacillus sp. AFS023182 TaxID=2033492 RepID=UPI001145C85B|nr:hypothetical protein [Bacillus sp. AFS023182]
MKHNKLCFMVLIFLSLVGIILILKSIDLAELCIHSWVQKMGGDTDIVTYNMILNNYVSNIQLLGGIIFGISFFFLIYSLFFVKKTSVEK